MKKMWIIAALAASAGALPAVAEAATAFSTANVNMRSGPSTRYPAVIVVPAGTRVNIQGCMSSANWCDVSFAGYRGWVSGSYLQTTYSQRRVAVGEALGGIGARGCGCCNQQRPSRLCERDQGSQT